MYQNDISIFATVDPCAKLPEWDPRSVARSRQTFATLCKITTLPLLQRLADRELIGSNGQ